MLPFLDHFFVITISAGCFIMAGIVALHNYHKRVNQVFVVLATSLALWIIAAYLSDLPQLQSLALFLNRFLLAAVIGTMGGMTFLSFTFPKKITLPNWVTPTLAIPGAVISLLTVFTPLTIRTIEFKDWGSEPIYGPLFTVFSIYNSLLILIAVVFFIRSYKRSRGLARKQMNYLFLGLSVFAFITVFVHVVLTNLLGTVEYYKLGNYSAIFFVGLLATAIVKTHLFDIRLIIARSIAYALSVLTLGSTYVLSFYFVGRNFLGLTESNNNQIAFFTVLSLILIFLFQPILKLFNKITTNIFYKQPYSSEELLEELGHIVRSNISLEKLTHKTLQKISETVHIAQTATLVLEDEECIHEANVGRPPLAHIPHQDLKKLLEAPQSMLVFENLEEGNIKQLMRQNHLLVFAPLSTSNEVHGVLMLGEKLSGNTYSQQDIDMLEIFIPQITVAIQNAKSYEEIKRFNITLKEEIEAATKKLKEQNKHLKHLSKLKNEFIFIATHELKNPVAAIKGYLSMFDEGTFGELPKETKDALGEMSASTHQLVQLVNDLLQVARTESATLEINPQPMNLCQIADTVAQNVKALASQKNITIQHECSSDKQFEVHADPDRVKEIFNNLYSNAIKYSEKGTIAVSHHVQDGKVITHVKDQGVGISQENQEKLFTRFFRAEEEAAKGIPGTGLGLYIIKQFIEKMGGEIWVESEKGKGSTFSFSLPESSS